MAESGGSARSARVSALNVDELSTHPSQTILSPPRSAPTERSWKPEAHSHLASQELGAPSFPRAISGLSAQLGKSMLDSRVRQSEVVRVLEEAEREARAALAREKSLAERLEQTKQALLRACVSEDDSLSLDNVSVQLSSEAQFVPVEPPAQPNYALRQLSAGAPPALRTDMRFVRARMRQLSEFFQACEHSREAHSKPLRTPTA